MPEVHICVILSFRPCPLSDSPSPGPIFLAQVPGFCKSLWDHFGCDKQKWISYTTTIRMHVQHSLVIIVSRNRLRPAWCPQKYQHLPNATRTKCIFHVWIQIVQDAVFCALLITSLGLVIVSTETVSTLLSVGHSVPSPTLPPISITSGV